MTLKNQKTDSRKGTDAGDNNSGSGRNQQLPDHLSYEQDADLRIVIKAR
jgi:hypothetical protein